MATIEELAKKVAETATAYGFAKAQVTLCESKLEAARAAEMSAMTALFRDSKELTDAIESLYDDRS